MRYLLGFLDFLLGLTVPARVDCWLGSHAEGVRQPLGGMRCRRCGKAASDSDDLGHYGEGYVSPVRRVFQRYPVAVERTSAWPEPRPEKPRRRLA